MSRYKGGVPLSGPMTVVGRASRSGPLDHIIETHGRWLARLGEIDQNELSNTRAPLGQVSTVTVTGLTGKPKLTIVGFARMATQDDTQNAWALPGEITALEKAGAPRQYQMLYTFRHAATVAQVGADLRELRAALPAGAIIAASSALSSASLDIMGRGIKASSVIPYAVMALLLAAVIIAAVAAGAVLAGDLRIGVLKSIGFTPVQIAATYLAQLGAPALAGALAGTVLGSLWVLPQIQETPVFGVRVAVPVWIDAAVPAGMVALAGLAALLPAVRAGRLSAVQAITAGLAPRAVPGHAAQRLAARLPLPRPVTAGLAAPLARPARSAATLATITIGLTAAVLAVGLNSPDHQDRAQHRPRIRSPRAVPVADLAGDRPGRHRRLRHAADAGPGTSPRPRDTQSARDDPPAGHHHGQLLGRRPRHHRRGHRRARRCGTGTGGRPRCCHRAGRPSREHRPPHARPSQRDRRKRPPTAPATSRRPRRNRAVHPPRQNRDQRRPPGGRTSPTGGLFSGPLVIARQNPYTPGELVLLVLAGLAIALAGALGPAIWAAATKTTTALHAE